MPFEVKYSKEEKLEALRRVDEGGETVLGVACDIGCDPKSIRNWRVEFGIAPAKPHPNQKKDLAQDFEDVAKKALDLCHKRLKSINIEHTMPKQFIEIATQAIQASRLLRGESTQNVQKTTDERILILAAQITANPDKAKSIFSKVMELAERQTQNQEDIIDVEPAED